MKRFIVIGIILLFVCMSFNPSFAFDNPVSSGNTLYVGGSGEGNYTRIQDAVDNASNGDTVFVFDVASPYQENIVIDKSIFLIGENKNTVVIDADFNGSAMTVIASNVFVSGFTMIHPPVWFNNFESELVDIVSVENVTIKDNILQQEVIEFGGDRGGIIIRRSSYCFIQNNTITKGDDFRPCWGIVLMIGSAFINVSGNEINLYTGGILIWSSSDNVIYMNYLHHNSDGIDIAFGDNNTIINNVINFNTGEGIRIDDGYNNVIFRNIISDNGDGNDNIDDGIGLIGASDNYISYNQISNNNPYGIQMINAHNNTITYNNISKNKIGVFFYTSYKNYIISNNFILNKKNGYFDRFISIRDRMIWDRNYWNKPRSMPYPIFGIGHLPLLSFIWVVFDWYPAKEPYDIRI